MLVGYILLTSGISAPNQNLLALLPAIASINGNFNRSFRVSLRFLEMPAQPAFTSKLSGNNEVPPVTTAASGIATFQLLPLGHQLVMSYQLSLKNITGVTAALIHNDNQ